jgi:hypothetical protein
VHNVKLYNAIMARRASELCSMYMKGGEHMCSFGATCCSRHDPVELAKVMAAVELAKAAEKAKLAAAVAAAALPVASSTPSAFTAAPLVHAAPLVMAS